MKRPTFGIGVDAVGAARGEAPGAARGWGRGWAGARSRACAKRVASRSRGLREARPCPGARRPAPSRGTRSPSLSPSSSQDSSNSLEPTMPYQYWWPNSWIVTISIDRGRRSNGQRVQTGVGVAARDEGRVLHAARALRRRPADRRPSASRTGRRRTRGRRRRAPPSSSGGSGRAPRSWPGCSSRRHGDGLERDLGLRHAELLRGPGAPAGRDVAGRVEA